MSPLFGRKDHDQEPEPPPPPSETELAVGRLEPMSMTELAAEVMGKVFGPDGPGGSDDETFVGSNLPSGVTLAKMLPAFVPDGPVGTADQPFRLQLLRLLSEALQTLEHAALIRSQVHQNMTGFNYVKTRLGEAALERGAVEYVLGGGSLDDPGAPRAAVEWIDEDGGATAEAAGGGPGPEGANPAA